MPKGGIVVCDRGYNDYGWYKSLAVNVVFYVTRQRINASYELIELRAVTDNAAVISDLVIRYNSLRSQKERLPDVRQVVLTLVLKALPYTETVEQIEALLPWNLKK